MEYRVILVLQIYNFDRSKVAYGKREIVLPFAPFDGLELRDDKKGPFTLKAVSWSIDEQYFVCIIEEQEDDMEMIDMDFLIKDARECGWAGFEKIMPLKSSA